MILFDACPPHHAGIGLQHIANFTPWCTTHSTPPLAIDLYSPDTILKKSRLRLVRCFLDHSQNSTKVDLPRQSAARPGDG